MSFLKGGGLYDQMINLASSGKKSYCCQFGQGPTHPDSSCHRKTIRITDLTAKKIVTVLNFEHICLL